MLRLWRKPQPAAARRPAATTAKYGGMQVRELQTRLELLIDPTRNSHSSVHDAALALAEYNLVEQNRFLRTLDRLAHEDAELALQFCSTAPPALGALPEEAWQPWVEHLLELRSTRGLPVALTAVADYSGYRKRLGGRPGTVAYTDIAPIMEAFVRGLSGRPLRLDVGNSAYTDTQTLFFPARIGVFPERSANFQLYKAYAAHQWAQTRFGTWDLDPQSRLHAFADAERALRLFHRLETIRLDACIARELPGVAREMRRFRSPDTDRSGRWREATRALSRKEAGVADSLEWLSRVYDQDDEPPPAAYEGVLQPVLVSENRETADERRRRAQAQPEATPPSGGEADRPDRYDDTEAPQSAGDTSDATPPGSGFVYDEWDEACQRYRKNWCRLSEQPLEAAPGRFRAKTLDKYRGLVLHLRRNFEMLQQDVRPARREHDGEDIDLDALVETLADLHNGREMDERVFVRTRRDRRSVATLFLLDVSASTRGRVNEIEREALILLCEALEQLSDRYAIFGFSGRGHRACVSYPVKTFGERYGEPVWQRIGGMQAREYTRMGAAIRHHSAKLLSVEARTRLLIVLTDGRPDDQDGYRGAYGVEDTRRAILETRHAGIHPFCITIDTEAGEYLPRMFGDSFSVIDQVEKLPWRICDIYRKLTV